MKCQNCGKNETNFKYTEVINGVKKELNLCAECAKKMGVDDLNFSIPINFSSFFGDFLNDFNEQSFIPTLVAPKKMQCDSCNMTYDEFMNIGKFGCSHCYEVFSDRIDPVLKRLHGNTKYLGRKSNISTNIIDIEPEKENNEIDNLKRELKLAIKEEKYEKAAELRDKIKDLEGGKKS